MNTDKRRRLGGLFVGGELTPFVAGEGFAELLIFGFTLPLGGDEPFIFGGMRPAKM
jgi:hypothetical protein